MRRMMAMMAVSAALMIAQMAWGAAYAEGTGPSAVGTIEATWQDAARKRDVPVLICYPKESSATGTSAAKYPVIVFSHGLGGTRDTYSAYGMHWASYGYVVIFPQHHGSDSAVIGHGMAEMLMGKNDLQPFLDRVGDVHFVLDQVALMNAGKLEGTQYAPLKGRMDLSKIGMSGHSFGAVTTQAIVGEKYSVPAADKFVDPRVTAGIAMSGSASSGRNQDKAFGSIKIPMFYLTGTADKAGLMGPADRRVPFDHSTFPATYLLTFDGANHMTFGPRQRLNANAANERFQSFIRQSTTAFWDAYLKGDAAAKTWFTTELPKELGAVGKFEQK
jgi:predicted dienelactone hydrolase